MFVLANKMMKKLGLKKNQSMIIIIENSMLNTEIYKTIKPTYPISIIYFVKKILKATKTIWKKKTTIQVEGIF